MQPPTVKLVLLAVTIVLGLFVETSKAHAAKLETTVLAGGCFWCVESDFESVKGVTRVVSGYSGGSSADASYKKVTKGGTGHYEVVQITYNPSKVSYDEILRLFLRSVDPTDAGGQFCDRGKSYRTAIFVKDDQERAAAKAAIASAQSDLGHKIVTPVKSASPFYEAEDYHQDYYKGKKIVVTRRGPKSQASAYKFYRKACGRDAKVKALWGDAAPFIGH